jgi:excisionase family DNA binding protein
MTKLLSIRESANVLGVSVPTIKRYVYARKLAFITLPGGHLRITEDALDAFILSRSSGPKEVSHAR